MKNVSQVSAANHMKPRDLDVKMMYFKVGQLHFYANHFEYYKIVSVSNFRDPSLDLAFFTRRDLGNRDYFGACQYSWNHCVI